MDVKSWVLIFLASSIPRFMDDLVKRRGSCSWSGVATEVVAELETTGWFGNAEGVGSGVITVGVEI